MLPSVPEAATTVYALLMMGMMDARNMQSNSAVNKYLCTVASCWISSMMTIGFYCLCHMCDHGVSSHHGNCNIDSNTDKGSLDVATP